MKYSSICFCLIGSLSMLFNGQPAIAQMSGLETTPTTTIISPTVTLTPPSTPTPELTTNNIKKDGTVKGTVLKNENNYLTLQTDDGIKEFSIPANIKITKNMMGTEITNVQPNDSVVITQNDNGEILSVDAVSGDLVDRAGTFLPLAMIGIGLILLGLLLSRSKNKGLIKTKPTNLS